VTRPAPTPDEDPTHEPHVRTHRVIYPNRRPLLISAILVALTSIPTIIVVAAGTVTLHDREPSRPPAIADPSGPVVVQPHSSAGLREEPPLASESGHGRPADHTSAQAAGSGGGGAFSPGTGGSQPTVVPSPVTIGATGGKGSSGGTGSSSTGSAGSGSGSGSTSTQGNAGGTPAPTAAEDCPTPTPSATPAPHPTQGSGGRIDDDAWPGWDAGFHG
jgi:hypothetical protein